MKRALRRRRERTARKGRLSADDALLLDDKRCLPNFPVTFDGQHPIWTEPEQVQPLLVLIRKSGLAESLERRLRDHPGNPSRISMEAVLLAMMLAAELHTRSYRRVDLCAILNGLRSEIAYQLGLWNLDNPPPVSYHALCEQIQRLEAALGATWTGDGDTIRDLDWLCRTLIKAGIPRKHRKLITSVSLDGKILESWGKSQIRMSEKDALAEHRLKERENPDLAEPELPTGRGTTTKKIGEPGPDGRVIRSHDLHARLGYKTGTARDKPRIVLGYDLHLATGVPAAKKWTGDPDKLAFKKAPPRFILAMTLAPGSTNPGPIGLDLVAEAKRIAPGINEVIADRGYTNKRKTFCRELHRQGMNVVMDYNPKELEAPKTVYVGRGDKQQLKLYAGSFYPPWLPEKLYVMSENPADDQPDEPFGKPTRWRWTVHGYLKDGAVQLICPQCAGRVKTTARTRNGNTTLNQWQGPVLHIDDEYCCEGLMTVPVEKLDSFQRIPWGTPAQKKSYGRRNASETKNSMLGDNGGFALGWCRVFNQMAFTLGALMKVITHNLAEIARFRRNQPKHEKAIPETETAETPPNQTPSTPAESPRGPP